MSAHTMRSVVVLARCCICGDVRLPARAVRIDGTWCEETITFDCPRCHTDTTRRIDLTMYLDLRDAGAIVAPQQRDGGTA